MGFGGIIAGALGGGATQAIDNANTTIAQNNKVDLMNIQQQLDIEKMKRAEEIRQSGILAENSGAIADARVGFNSRNTTAVGTAQTGVEVDRTKQMTQPLVDQTTALGKAKGDVERGNLAAMGSDKAALAGAHAVAVANHVVTAGEQAQAYALSRTKIADDMQDVAVGLRAAGDEEGAKKQEALVAALRGTAGKSYADVVKAADVYQKMAAEQDAILSDPMKSSGLSQEQKAQITSQASRYRSMADSILAETANKRGVPAQGAPGSVDQAKAHADAQAAVATGRITLDEANKRLASAGLPALPAKASQAKQEAAPSQPKGVVASAMAPDAQGVIGLGENTLARMAEDPSNPLQKAAADRLKQLRAGRVQATADRVTSDPATDPSLYSQ